MTSRFRFVARVSLLCVLAASAASAQSPSSAHSPPEQRYAAVDRYALAASPYAEQSVDHLAAYLARAQSDHDKVRAIYRWMTDRIAYDARSFLMGHTGDTTAEGVLRKRRGVCSGYTALFTALAQRCGLQTVTINGYSKGVGHHRGAQVTHPNHAWNAVKLDNRWHLLDVTWGAGHLNGNRFVKKYQECFFCTPPAQLIFTHFPQDPGWQLLQPQVTPAQFASLPTVDPPIFELGVTHDALWKSIQVQGFPGFVKVYDHDGPVSLQAAPLGKVLQRGKGYVFRVEAPHVANMAVVNNGQWIWLQRNGSYFEGVVTPSTSGDLKLSQQRRPSDRLFQTILGYEVQ